MKSIVYNSLYTIFNRSAALSLQKVSVGKVDESVSQAIKVSGDVEKWVIVFLEKSAKV